MWTDRVRVLDDTSPGDWILPRLGPWGSVTGLLPGGFDAYVRILHPTESPADGRDPDADRELVRWSRVAATTGRVVHPLVQWHRLVGAPDDPWNARSDLWPEGRPQPGSLAVPDLASLITTLARHTATSGDALMAMWEGWGRLNGGTVRVTVHDDGSPPTSERLPAAFTDTEWAAPRLVLPDRTYLLLRGPLDAALDVTQGPDGPGTQSPSLIWPADRTWCVSTEVDHDSTLVAGTRSAVDAVLAHPDLEAFEVGPLDRLTFDGDVVN